MVLKKRQVIVLWMVMVMLLNGCTKVEEKEPETSFSSVKEDERSIWRSKEITEDVVENEIKTKETEELSGDTREMKYIYTEVLMESEEYKSISVVQQPGEAFQCFEVKLESDEVIYLEEPAGMDVWSIGPVVVLDLNEDGMDEIAFMCGQTAYYQGIYVIDVKNKCFLEFPYREGGYVPGIAYEVYAVDYDHIRVASIEFAYDEIVEISYEELCEMNDIATCSVEVQEKFKDTFQTVEGTNIGGGSEVLDIQGITYEGNECLLIVQPLKYGRQNILGWMETILSWDKTGAYHIEKINYRKEK